MKVRKTEKKEVEEAAAIYDTARAFMKASGNPKQWSSGRPNAEDIKRDIDEGCSYVVEENGELIAIFYFRIGVDSTYKEIFDGCWLNSEPYAVIHRVAVKRSGKGIASKIFDWCFSRFPNLKIDTHRDNLPMQHSLEKAGFKRCGIIYLENGEERIAYQKR